MASAERLVLAVDGDEVRVEHRSIRQDRAARMFFEFVLGAKPIADGWIVPRRSVPLADHVVRINSWLERHGWIVDRRGVVDEAVQRDLERRRSYERTRLKAAAMRSGTKSLDTEEVFDTLLRFGWNRGQRDLRDHQIKGLLHGLTAINVANFSVPGSGKTATTLAVAATHISSGTVDVVYVVGPLSSFGPWEKETRAALGDRLHPKRIRGTASQRRDRYDAVQDRDILLMSYATAAADQSALIHLARARKVMLVVDESHRIKRFKGGVWAPALMRIAQFARVRVVLSGTPMPQSGRDLYSQLTVLWPGRELTGARDAFAISVDNDFPALIRRVQPFVSRAPKDVLGLPPVRVHRHDVPLNPLQAEIYELIEAGFRRRLQDAASYQEKIDTLRRARPIRLLQAATNPELLNRRDPELNLPPIETGNPTLMDRLRSYRQEEAPAKAQRAVELVKSETAAGRKVVVWSNFVFNLDQLTIAIRAARIPCYQVDGRIPVGDESTFDSEAATGQSPFAGETRESIIDAFLSSERPSVLVANPASCSESISLHSACRTAIYVDRTYDCALYLQSIDRIHRLGLPPDADVDVHLLISTSSGRPTIDDLVDASLISKEMRMRQLLEGAELQPLELPDDLAAASDGDNEDLGRLLRYLLGEER